MNIFFIFIVHVYIVNTMADFTSGSPFTYRFEIPPWMKKDCIHQFTP